MQCALYDAGRCRSCQWIEQPVSEQLTAKMADLQQATGSTCGGRVVRTRQWPGTGLSQ